MTPSTTGVRMSNHFLPDETVYCRFTREAYVVLDCDGVLARVRDADCDIVYRIVGELTRRAPEGAVA